MSYDYEGDDLRQEVRQGYASNAIVFWPKDSSGNITLAGGDSGTYVLKSPAGTTLASGTATKTTASGGSSYFSIAVDASNTTTWELAEGYSCTVTWTYSSKSWVRTFRFDCVAEPWLPDVSLNDLLEEVGDAGVILARQAAAIATGRTAAQRAGELGVKAWGEIRQRLVNAAHDKGRIYPRLILDREAIRGVVVAAAIARMYRWEAGDQAGEAAYQVDRWTAETARRFGALGELDYDADEDQVADSKLGGWSSVQLVRRAW